MKTKLLSTIVVIFILSLNSYSQTLSTCVPNGYIGAMAAYNNELIVGGTFNVGNYNVANNIAKWDGYNWSILGTGVNGSISDIKVFNNQLYVCGSFTTAGGDTANLIAKWNGFNWFSVDGAEWSDAYRAEAMEVFNNELYVSVRAGTVGSGYVTIYSFDGTLWKNRGAVNNGGYSARINMFKIYGGNLFAAGEFSSIGGTPSNNIAKFNGLEWESLGTGIPLTTTGGSSCVYDMEVYNDELYVGGKFKYAGGLSVNNIAKWNDTNWSAVGSGQDVNTELMVFNSELYVKSYFNIQKWNGKNWTTFLNSSTEKHLFVYNSQLIYDYFTQLNPFMLKDTQNICEGNVYTINSHTYSKTGTYTDKLVSVSGCDSTIITQLTVFPLPSIPTVIANGNILTSSPSNEYQWYFNGKPIEGATLYQYKPEKNGSYKVKITDENGCSSFSDLYNYVTGIEELSANNIGSFSPNPGNGVFELQFTFLHIKNIEVNVYNILGGKVYQSQINQSDNFKIDISSQPNGIYFFNVKSGNRFYYQKIVKE